MTKIKNDTIVTNGTFEAIANVSFHLPVAMFDDIKLYNEKYISEVNAVNGTNNSIPAQMNLRSIERGDIILVGDKIIVDPETGNISVYPIDIYKKLNNQYVDLPCAMLGEVDSNFDKSMQNLPYNVRKNLELQKNHITEKYRRVPVLEKYIGQELED